MTAVLGGSAGVRWPAGPRSGGRRRPDRSAFDSALPASVLAEPRLRLTSRCRSLLLVAALLAVVGAGVVHGSAPLGIAGTQPRPVAGPAPAPGLPLGTALAGPAAGPVRAGVPAGSVATAAAPAIGVVIVAVGDSLWGIATHCSGAGPATAVSWIRAANGLRGSLLQPGQSLVIPSGLRCR